MARNPFTSETKGDPVRLDNGVIGQLRFPPTVKARVLAWKPEHQGLGEYALKAMYDDVLIAAIRAGHYREVTAALVADWGWPTTSVSGDDGRSGESKPLAKAATR